MDDIPRQPFRIKSQTQTSSSWAYDSTIGIVHRHGCQICRSYRTHLDDADESDSDYTHAIHDRDAEFQKHYQDGFHKGRETQRQYEDPFLKLYRSQRDSARNARLLCETKLEETEAEVAHLRDELLTLRLAYEQLQAQTPPEDLDWMTSYEPIGGFDLDESDFGIAAWGPSESSDEYEEDSWGPVCAGAESDDGEDIEEESYDPSDWAVDSVGALEHPSSRSLVETDELLLSLFSLLSATEDERRPSNVENLPSHLLQSSPSHPRLPIVPLHQLEYDTPEGIRRKMELAWYPGHEHTLAEVKALVSAAHMTPTHERTEVQRILLNEWRSPLLSPSTWRGPEAVGSSDVCVDASQLGIGFVFKNQWQAWVLKAGWKERTREIQWAEAVAVELGVRLMIKAGYRQRTLRLRSDNSGVVEAVAKENIYQSQVGETVERIYRLCEEHDITLEIKWIPGWANPADPPSRLCPEQGSPRFPHAITIPRHLREFVLPYVP